MRYFLVLVLLFALNANHAFAQGIHKEMPVTGEDIKNALNLKIHRYRIDFDSPGSITVEANGSTGPVTHSLPIKAKSASLVAYVEKESNPDISTLHFWLSADGASIYAYISFQSNLAKVTTTQSKGDVFSIVAKPAEKSEQTGYSLKVTRTP